VARTEIIARVEHIRELHRQRRPKDDREQSMFDRRERALKDFLSNAPRTSTRPMLNMVHAIEEACSLTTDGAYRLFGYELDGIREFDLRLNGARTHIIESYVFERDLLVQLPLELAPESAFEQDATLGNLVRRWQNNIPIRALESPGWRRPGTFYVRIGTADSHGSGLPAGATAMVEPISRDEARQPNPRSLYLLQFASGYRCSRCVVTRGKLHVLSSTRLYTGPEQFPYPSAVRIAGRLRAVALALPPLNTSLRSRSSGPSGNASLILPWEHSTRAQLFTTKHRRFLRSEEEIKYVTEVLTTTLQSKLSDRTRRRYRQTSDSDPHLDSLIQMSLEHYARYSDALRTGGHVLRDARRFSLETMLHANRYEDLLSSRAQATLPTPQKVWQARLDEFVEWPALLSLKFPQLSFWGDRLLRLAQEADLPDCEPRIRAGTWMLLEELRAMPDIRSDAVKNGWERPLYVLRRGLDSFLGRFEHHDNGFALTTHSAAKVTFGSDDLPNVRRVCGAVIPV
jgi:hypothetical protein